MPGRISARTRFEQLRRLSQVTDPTDDDAIVIGTRFGPYSVRSRASSLSVPTASHLSAIAFARVTTEANARALIPRLRAVSR